MRSGYAHLGGGKRPEQTWGEKQPEVAVSISGTDEEEEGKGEEEEERGRLPRRTVVVVLLSLIGHSTLLLISFCYPITNRSGCGAPGLLPLPPLLQLSHPYNYPSAASRVVLVPPPTQNTGPDWGNQIYPPKCHNIRVI